MAEDRSETRGGVGDTPAGAKFYQGRIRKLFQGGRAGVILSDSGREVPFTFAHVMMVGPCRRFEDLREGLSVGFDVGWTANGLRVTVICCRD